MRVGELKIDRPVTMGRVTLIPVARISTYSKVLKENAIFIGSKTPVVLVVLAPGSTKVLEMDGEEVPPDEIPGLEEVIAEMQDKMSARSVEDER